MEIIGVVKDVKYTNLRDDIPEQAFEPYRRRPVTRGGMTVYLRTTLDPISYFPPSAPKSASSIPLCPSMPCEPTEEQYSNSLSTERLIASLSAVFGFLATLLATIGLYGVMAYTVARRTREIGIRHGPRRGAKQSGLDGHERSADPGRPRRRHRRARRLGADPLRQKPAFSESRPTIPRP